MANHPNETNRTTAPGSPTVRIRTVIAVAALLPASLAFTVTADDHGGEEPTTTCRVDEERTITVDNEDGTTSELPVEYCETSIYAHCDGTLDEDGAAKLHDPTAAIELTPGIPEASFTEGAGCGTVDEPVFSASGTGGSPYQFAASGIAEGGNVDSLTFELHFLGPNTGYAGEPLYIDLEATVDSTSLFGTETTPNATGQNPTTTTSAQRIEVVPEVSDTGASVKALFTVTGVEQLFDVIGPDEQQYRSVSFSFGVPHIGQCGTLPTNDTPRCVPSGLTGWVMGASEIPTGVTFNPAEPAAVTVPVVVEEEQA